MAKDPRRRPPHGTPGHLPEPERAALPPSAWERAVLLWILLAASVWFAYWGVLSSDFVHYDDGPYIFENPTVRKGLTPESAVWALTATESANWHPLTWLSHMLDAQLFGLEAGRHHGVSLLLHTLNALLLLLLLERLTGALGRSALVAALFALHPLHVESVAWVAERKDVLSTLLWLLTLAAWLAFLRSRRPRWYALALTLYALGLMAKPMLVSLPFTLLLLDFWPLGRFALPPAKSPVPLRTLLLEKLPLLALAAASAAVTFAAQRAGAAVQTLESLPIPARVANAVWAYSSYLLKTVWPSSLAVFYPLPRLGHPAWQVALAALVLVAITAASWRLRKRAPYLLVGWLGYLGTLVPVIGLVQVGSQSMADRYTYVPLIGIFVALAWGLGDLVAARPGLRPTVVAASLLALLALAALTRIQVRYWKDSEALFSRAIAVTEENCVAHNNLGLYLYNTGDREKAVLHLREAIRIKPDYADAHDNLGIALERMGHPAEAKEHYALAVKFGSRSPIALVNRGNALVGEGRVSEAADLYRAAIRLQPGLWDAHYNLGLALTTLGRLPEAAEEFRECIALFPDKADAYRRLGRVMAAQGNLQQAMVHYGETLRREPESAEAHNDLGAALVGAGRPGEAASEYAQAIRLKPDHAEAHNNLGLALASMGRIPEAAARFEEAIRLRPDFADAHNNLGVALARMGRTTEATGHFREALRIAPDFQGARDNLAKLESHATGDPAR